MGEPELVFPAWIQLQDGTCAASSQGLASYFTSLSICKTGVVVEMKVFLRPLIIYIKYLRYSVDCRKWFLDIKKLF